MGKPLLNQDIIPRRALTGKKAQRVTRNNKMVNPINNIKELRGENDGKGAEVWPLICPFL